MRRTSTAVVAVAAVLAVAGCGTSGEQAGNSGPASVTSPSATPASATSPSSSKTTGVTRGAAGIGVVTWFNAEKGYGFIRRDTGEEVFVHYTAIVSEGYRNLEAGERVTFDIRQGGRMLQAENVYRLDPPPATTSAPTAEVRGANEMHQGVVKWYLDSKGIGIITLESGDEVFVHFSAIYTSAWRVRTLEKGATVNLTVRQGPQGLEAERVFLE